MSAPLVDLRARRVEANLARLRALFDANPETADRFAAVVSGALPCPPMESEPMDTENRAPFVAIRIPPSLVDRAEQLTTVARDLPDFLTVGRMSPSAVIRVALVRGLASLEREAAKLPKPADTP